MAKTPENLNETIAELETKLRQAKALKQKIEAQKKAAKQKLDRANDTRRKILIGAAFMANIKAGRTTYAELQTWLDPYLTRTDERALFDLPPLPPAPAPAPVDPQSSGPAVQEQTPVPPASAGESAPPAQSGV